jgi:nucleotide-binding universal stress UspA family protein
VKRLSGRPWEQIIKHATAPDVAYIVMGTHGRTGIAHVVLGSVAERVLRRAPCPVVIVPPAR